MVGKKSLASKIMAQEGQASLTTYNLPPAAKKEWQSLLADVAAGEYDAYSNPQLAAIAIEHFGFTLGRTYVAKLIRDAREGAHHG